MSKYCCIFTAYLKFYKYQENTVSLKQQNYTISQKLEHTFSFNVFILFFFILFCGLVLRSSRL